MNVLFDGLDINPVLIDFLSNSEINLLETERKKPFLNSSRYCLPFPLLSFFNFVYYPESFLKKNSVDLIVSYKVFPLNKTPWISYVEDFHYLNAFYSYFNKESFFSRKMNFVGKNLIKNSLNSVSCKKIICLSNYAKKTVLFGGGKKLEEKTVVCYPGIKPGKQKKKEKENISLLFVATNPVYKGTEFVFLAFKKLKEKYDIQLNCYGNFSEETKKNFPEINFDFVSRKEFDKILQKNDILLMPSLMESFGFTVLQAFSNSIPVVSSDVMALPEINKENETGFLIKFSEEYHKKLFFNPYFFFHESKKLNKEKIVSQLVEKTSLLIEDSSLRKKFGRNAFNEIEKGKFSLKQKENNMKQIFSELT